MDQCHDLKACTVRVARDDHDGEEPICNRWFRVSCMCGWMSDEYLSENYAQAAHDQHRKGKEESL
jgi:hypothetical protein